MKYFEQIIAKKLGGYWNICTFALILLQFNKKYHTNTIWRTWKQ